MSHLLALLLLASLQGAVHGDCSTPVLHTHDGPVCGGVEISRYGQVFQSYQGIPYASPPTGQLRFLPPTPPQPWEEVLDVSEHKTEYCTQYSYFGWDVAGQEDCLYLNVYTPETTGTVEGLPVMVWIYGGSWAYGSGTWEEYGPEMFMDHGVLLVTFNYRLGSLGFLSLGVEEVPGNQGLHDMILALTWVQNNIEVFGGDPNKVTIFGESAGSWACSYLTVSPQARGLFNRAILQSGAFTHPGWPWLSRENGTKLGYAAVDLLNCSNDELGDILDCLQAADIEDILALQLNYLIDSSANIDDSILPESPIDLIKKGEVNTNEIIIGTVKDEGLLSTVRLVLNSSLYSDIGNNWAWYGPRELFGKRGEQDITDQDVDQAYEVLDFYIGNETNFDEEHFDNLTNMMTDGYWYGTDKFAELLVEQEVTVFQYMFSYKGENSYLDSYGLNSSSYGVAHSDELYYMFNPYWFGVFELNPEDLKISSMFMKLWTDFAKFGDPTPPGAEVETWKPVTRGDHRYLDIGQDQVKMGISSEYQRRVKFWEELMSTRPPVRDMGL